MDSKVTYHGLDALRGVAAIMVVAYHMAYMAGHPLAPGGYLAVDLFFVLSGFVIAHSYDRRLATDLTPGKFLVIRLIRFWPLYAAGLAIGALFEVLLIVTHNDYAQAGEKIVSFVALGLFFLPTAQTSHFNYAFPLNVVSWSLFFEIAINIVYAFTFPFLRRKVLIGLIAVSGVGLILTGVSAGSLNLGAGIDTFDGGFLRCTFSFSLGMAIYRLGIRAGFVPLWMLLVIVIAILAAPVSPAVRPWFDLGFVLLVSPFLVISAASRQPSGAMVRLAIALGGLSYALYTLHRPILLFAVTATKRLHISGSIAAIVFLLSMLALSLIVHQWVDTPLRHWLLARLRLSRIPQPGEASAP